MRKKAAGHCHNIYVFYICVFDEEKGAGHCPELTIYICVFYICVFDEEKGVGHC